MKAILVVDIPDDMSAEETKALNVTLYNGLIVKELKIDCPLKPLPRKAIGDSDFALGWNWCLDELLGEEL